MIEGEDNALEIFGAPIDEAVGEELGGQVRDLLQGMFGGVEERDATEATEATEETETTIAEPVSPEE